MGNDNEPKRKYAPSIKAKSEIPKIIEIPIDFLLNENKDKSFSSFAKTTGSIKNRTILIADLTA